MAAHFHAAQADDERAADQQRVQRHHQADADEAKLFTDHGENEVGMHFGQVVQLQHGAAEADARPFAATDRHQGIGQLVAAAERIGPRIGE